MFAIGLQKPIGRIEPQCIGHCGKTFKSNERLVFKAVLETTTIESGF